MPAIEAEIHREVSILEKDQDHDIGVGSKSQIPNLNAEHCLDSEGEEKSMTLTCLKPRKAKNCLSRLYYELRVEIFARIPCCKYWKFQLLNREFSGLLQSSKIFKVRQERGLLKSYVFMRTTGSTRWTMFDNDFKNFQMLSEVPSDEVFLHRGDKETICAGTQLIVVGRDMEGIVVWRYELEKNKWFKGPAMITPRVLYGSASHGTNAFFAGGNKTDGNGNLEVLRTAEKYNALTKTWTSIHDMHKQRRYCSGCFFRGKFYVIGGIDENNEFLSCGECYDEKTDSWKLIPNMLQGIHLYDSQSPPLIAVVNDNLYLLATYSNELNIYDINANVWKKLGTVPVRADSASGWGVAFKSIGDRILLIGSLTDGAIESMTVYTCHPSTNVQELTWEEYKDFENNAQFSDYIYNCCVMFA